MRKADQRGRSAVNLYERLGAVTIDERARLHAKARLARAEYVAGLIDRAASAFGRLMRARIVRPIGRLLGMPIRGARSSGTKNSPGECRMPRSTSS